jgi:DNA-binding GntR family transcriptional regulator
MGTSRRDDEPGVTEAHDQLLEIRTGKVFFRRDPSERRRALAEVPPELNHQPDAIFALCRERDGAAAVECRAGGRVSQEIVLNPE